MLTTLTKALTRRLMHGDVEIKHDERGPYVEYDHLEVYMFRDSLHVDLKANRFVVASTASQVLVPLHMQSNVIEGLSGRVYLDSGREPRPIGEIYERR